MIKVMKPGNIAIEHNFTKIKMLQLTILGDLELVSVHNKLSFVLLTFKSSTLLQTS